jgi:mRNA-degrading endonuclease RelE of RelBE toxin-antitoxin system
VDSESSDTQPEIQIELTPEFQQELRILEKRYRNARSDVQSVIDELLAKNFVGDRISGVGGHIIFKVRVRNSDIQKGKSAGYRLIYQVESPKSLLLLTIYSKSDRNEISTSEIRNMLNEFYEYE